MIIVRNVWHFVNTHFRRYWMGFRRKWTSVVLCKSARSAIQLVSIHYRNYFAIILNSAVYLSSARVSMFHTLVPQLFLTSASYNVIKTRTHNKKPNSFRFCFSNCMPVYETLDRKPHWLNSKLLASTTVTTITVPWFELLTFSTYYLFVLYSRENRLRGIATSYDTNQTAQLQKLARVMKFRI